MPQPHTRSTFDRNFNAAASSSKPIVAFTDSSHAPERGSDATACGAHARRTNGSANTDENTEQARQRPLPVALRRDDEQRAEKRRRAREGRECECEPHQQRAG